MICAKTILSGHCCNSDPGTPTPQETIPALRGGKDVSARPRRLREEDRHAAHMAGAGLCLELVLYEPPEAAVAGVADEDDVARPCGLQLHELHGLLELLDLALRVRVGPGNPRRLGILVEQLRRQHKEAVSLVQLAWHLASAHDILLGPALGHSLGPRCVVVILCCEESQAAVTIRSRFGQEGRPATATFGPDHAGGRVRLTPGACSCFS